MRGFQFSSDNQLPERELRELADELAIRLHGSLQDRVYRLERRDIEELITPFISDLIEADQNAVVWLVWDLIQEGFEEASVPVGLAASYVILFWIATILLGIMLGLFASWWLGII